MKTYFHTEVVNPVLAGWTCRPIILQQSEVSPLARRSLEKVDDFYTMLTSTSEYIPFLIGEYKKNVIIRD